MSTDERKLDEICAGNTPVYEIVQVGDNVHVRHVDDRDKCIQLMPSVIPTLIESLQRAYEQTKHL